MNVLEVNGLNIGFQSGRKTVLPAVSDVSFELKKGEILALVGESGCGKSVTCMSLAGLLPVPPAVLEKGSIIFRRGDGLDISVTELNVHELRRVRGGGIAYIFQEPSVSLNPVFRIGDQIAEAVLLHRPDVSDVKKEVVSLLEQVGIPSPETRIRSYPHEMSGGMLQRVMIAMALACKPEILIADEPTTALDVTIQAQILELIAKLRRENGMSVILVTHNLGIVSELADRVCVMYAGRIVETAQVRELLDHPRHPYTEALLRAVPVLGESETRRLSTIPGNVPMPADFPAGCRFSDRCPLCRSLSAGDAEVCRTRVPPMEEIASGHCCACHQIKGICHEQ